MRVLMVTHETSRTGAPRVAIMTTRGLREQGHDVRVVARFPVPCCLSSGRKHRLPSNRSIDFVGGCEPSGRYGRWLSSWTGPSCRR